MKLITLLRAHPARPVQAFREALAGPYAAAVSSAGPRRHEQMTPVDAGVVHAFDAADEIWFPTAAAALGYLRSEVGHAAARALGGLALGTERVIVRPHLVFGPRQPEA